MNTLIKNFLNYIIYSKHFSEKTIHSYEIDLLQFEEFLLKDKIKDLTKVNKFHIRNFMAYLSNNNLKKRTISRKIATLKSFYKFLIRENIIKSNPMALIKTPKFEKKLPVFLSENLLNDFLSSFETNNLIQIRDKMIFEILFATGIRSNEFVLLNNEDIDLKNKTVFIKHAKGKKQRIVPFNNSSLKAINNYLQARTKINIKDKNAFCVSKSGKRISNRDMRRIIKKYIQKFASLSNVSPHTLRHSFATAMLNNGADIRVVQELLGHESIATTQIYTHTSYEKLKKIYEKAHPLEKE